MSTIQNGLDQLYPGANRDLGIYVELLKQVIVGDVGRMLLLLFGAVRLRPADRLCKRRQPSLSSPRCERGSLQFVRL